MRSMLTIHSRCAYAFCGRLRSSNRRLSLIVALLLAAIPGMAIAQQITTGSLAGQVVDESSIPLPGATVTTISSQGTRTAQTDSRGRFLVPYLTPGAYAVRVNLEGYRTIEQSRVRVSLGHRVDLHFTLSRGAFEESIEVVADAPSSTSPRFPPGSASRAHSWPESLSAGGSATPSIWRPGFPEAAGRGGPTPRSQAPAGSRTST